MPIASLSSSPSIFPSRMSSHMKTTFSVLGSSEVYNSDTASDGIAIYNDVARGSIAAWQQYVSQQKVVLKEIKVYKINEHNFKQTVSGDCHETQENANQGPEDTNHMYEDDRDSTETEDVAPNDPTEADKMLESNHTTCRRNVSSQYLESARTISFGFTSFPQKIN